MCDRKAIREYYRARHRCVKCHEQDAYTLTGRAVCADCAQKSADWQREYRQKHPEREKEYKARRAAKMKEEGICRNCGKSTSGGHCRCPRCEAKENRRQREMRLESGVNLPRGENGYCWTCNKRPAAQGKRMCPVCLEKLSRNHPAAPSAEHIWRRFNGELFTTGGGKNATV